MKQKILKVLGISTLIISLISCSNNQTKKPIVSNYEKKDSPLYVFEESEEESKFVPDPTSAKITYHFFNKSVIPYYELSDYINNYSGYKVDKSEEKESALEYKKENNGYKIKINNKNIDTYLLINVDNQTLTFHNMTNYIYGTVEDKYPFECFFKNASYLFKDSSFTYEIVNSPKADYIIDLTKYNIKVFEYNDKCYAPTYVVSNVMWPQFFGSPVKYFYNGANTYDYVAAIDQQKQINPLADIRKNSSICSSSEYMQFNYDFLALVYDHFFGLDKRTSISTGIEHTYFKNGAYASLEPFKTKLLSTQLNVSNNGMVEFYNQEVNDGGHSSYGAANILTDSDKHVEYTGDYDQILKWEKALIKARKDASLAPTQHDNYFQGYYKEDDGVGFITFDIFDNESSKPLTKDDLAETEYGKHTATLFGYANQQIRAHSIKNIVIDLSCNGGGAGDAVMFIMSYLTGKGGTLSIRNPKDGAHIKVTGYADVNFDGKYDSNDVIPSDVNVYAIISNSTFSSANLLTVLLKENTNTKFIGTRSGGGSCNSSFFYSPLNAMCRISGLAQLGLNSSTKDKFTSDENGVIADFYKLSNDIKDANQFFDRTTIINKIKGK